MSLTAFPETGTPIPSLPPAEYAGRVFVAGHRGASGVRPEHTLDAYRTAIRMGADAIETDLVPTRDGVLVARHDAELSGTTDIRLHRRYACRRTVREVDGARMEGWFVEDFTLAELKGLTARERIPEVRPENAVFDDLAGIATLEEILDLVARESVRAGRRIGLLAELKHASHYDHAGLHVDVGLIDALDRHGLNHPGSGVVVMSFEPTILRRLSRRVSVPLVQIFDRAEVRPADLVRAGAPTRYADMCDPAWLEQIADYADFLAPHKSLVRRWEATGPGPVTGLVRNAAELQMGCWAWTLRAENRYLPAALRRGDDLHDHGDLAAEAAALLEAGVTGLISDHPDLVLPVARDARAMPSARADA